MEHSPLSPVCACVCVCVSAAGHLVFHMVGVILEESPRESFPKPPFVLGAEKGIVRPERDLDKILQCFNAGLFNQSLVTILWVLSSTMVSLKTLWPSGRQRTRIL